MGDKDYVYHVVNKYRLAVALSVIKNKPEDLTLYQYVELLKNNINNSFNNSDNDDIGSVTSQDFDITNDIELYNDSQKTFAPSIENTNINVHKIESNKNEIDRSAEQNYICTDLKNTVVDNVAYTADLNTQSYIKDIQSDTQAIFEKNVAISKQTNLACTEIEVLNESVNILEDFENPVVNGMDETENSQVLTDVLTILRSVDEEIYDLRKKQLPPENISTTQNISNSDQILNENPSDLDLDSQNTIPYTYTNSENYTHISQSQVEHMVIEKQYIVTKEKNKNGGKKYLQSKDKVGHDSQNINTNEDFGGNTDNIDNFEDVTNNMLTEESNEDLLVDDQALHQTSQTERIPFKIIEEMTRVRNLLNKRDRKISSDGYSTDSGYRSDSQKSFRSSLQVSDNWLNQSGCSLLHHVAQTPLSTSTQKINNEIARVLGKLIDRLQDEEKCPTFLEELLESVDLLLKNIHEGSSGEEMALTEKDENIQRLLLLNKSIHIQKYTITKITKILVNKHKKFTCTDVIPELENIDQIENLCYIFHVLEILIQEYVKNKHYLQTSQNSQTDEKFAKRSAITDIWRKKWNSVSKETVETEGSSEKICVLTKCREILNKIIVDCMNGYSLVAFSALQCFNLLQN